MVRFRRKLGCFTGHGLARLKLTFQTIALGREPPVVNLVSFRLGNSLFKLDRPK